MSASSFFSGFKRTTNSIHKIRELQLRQVRIDDHYEIIREIGAGDYGKVMLAEHKQSQTQVALKAVPKSTTPIRDFLVEFHYSYFLSPHHGILDTYDVAFETPEYYVFAQEVAPLGDLWQAIERSGGCGLKESDAKIVMEQITSALEFLHDKELVHRDVRAENVLIFSPDLTKVKLTDFGLTRKAGTLVKKRTRSLPTCPPETWELVHLEGYTVELGSDNWQLAMFVFTLLTGHFPWQKADITDPSFNYFAEWQKRKTTRTPKEFKRFTPRLLKMFRRMLEIKPSKRYPCKEVYKYLKDRWLNDRSPRSSTVKQFFNSSGNSDNYNPGDINYLNPGSMGGGVSRSLSCSQLLPSHPTMATACLARQSKAKEDTDVVPSQIMMTAPSSEQQNYCRGRSPAPSGFFRTQ